MSDLEFDRFVLDSRRRLRSYVLSRGVVSEDASDLVSEAFLRIWKHRKEIVGNPYNYACRVCSRLIVDAARSNSRRPSVHSVEDLAPSESLELYDCIRGKCLVPFERVETYLPEGLSEREAPLICASANGMNNKEVALAMSVPIGTARSMLHRARWRARRLIGAA